VKVVIHPQSIIHSMVVCRDQSVLAQLGTPDMRVPIAYGLSFPERIASGASALDFLSLKSLTFEAPERARFPGCSWPGRRWRARTAARPCSMPPTKRPWPPSWRGACVHRHP
jgi:1-deoxy-D-xylulose 5-phosphate reductoisomerase